MAVHAYHPETGHSAVLTDEQLAHLRLSGWMQLSEYQEQQAAKAAAEAAAAQPSKPSKSEGK